MSEVDEIERVVAVCWRIPQGRKVAHAVEFLPPTSDHQHDVERFRMNALCGATAGPKAHYRWSFAVYVGQDVKKCKACEVLYGLETVNEKKLPAAEPVDDYVWCLDCGEPHLFNAETGKIVIHGVEDPGCPALADWVSFVKTLPKDWDRTYHAGYSTDSTGKTKGYDIILKEVDPNPEAHRPMYYLGAEK